MITTSDKKCHPKNSRGCDRDINNSLKRETALPPKKYALPETTTQEDTLSLVPEIMRATARYLLLRTNRKNLSQKDIEYLKVLAENHMPARVQKEIDTCVERFIKNGKRLNTMNFGYIAACLSNQKSFKKKTSGNVSNFGNEKAVNPNSEKTTTTRLQSK